MKSVLQRFLLIFFLITPFTCLYSQEGAEIEINIHTTDTKTVVYDNVMYMLPNEQPSLSVSLLEEYSIVKINEAKLNVSNDTRQSIRHLVYTLQDGILAFSNTNIDLLEDLNEYSVDYTLTVTINYDVLLISSLGEDSVVTRLSEQEFPVKLHKKEYPEISITPIEKYQYAGNTIDIEINEKGGNQNGWTFAWPTGVTSDSKYTYTTNASETEEVNDETFEVEIINYAPDNTTVWYEDTAKFEILTYPKPVVTAGNDTELTVINNQSFNLSIKVEGGAEKTWEYKWLLNDQIIENETGISIDCVAKGDVFDRTDIYKVVATNKLDNRVMYEETITFTVLVEGVMRWANDLPDNVIEGDVIKAEVILKDAGSKDWIYTWTNDGEVIDCKTLTCDVVAGSGAANGRKTTLLFNAKTSDGKTDYTITHEYTIWQEPNSLSDSQNDIALLHNQNYTFAIITSGGYPQGWSYQWYLDETEISGATDKSYNVVASNQTDNVKHSVYKIVAKNVTYGEEVQFTHSFKLESWPEVNVSHSAEAQDIYYGDETNLLVNVTGGYSGGWKYIWNDNEDDVTKTNYNYYAEESAYDNNTEFIKLRILNLHDKAVTVNKVLFEKEIIFNITSWSHGKVMSVNLDAYHNDYKSDAEVPITVVTEGGYPNWEYTLYYNNEPKEVINSSSFKIKTQKNFAATYSKDSIRIVAKNSIPANGRSKTCEGGVSINVWPVIEVAEDFVMSCVSIGENTYAMREGDTLSMSIRLAKGANYLEDGIYWNYEWSENALLVNDSIVNDSILGRRSVYSRIAETSANYSYKSTNIYRFSLNISNESPYGEKWYEKSYPEKTVTVYSRPLTPTKLIVKGNGSSNTLICFSSVSNNDLISKGYEFVFGYTDKYGRDHFMQPTKNRWYSFDSNISVSSSSYKFWVIAQWQYDENTAITSGRIFLNSNVKDETFDASYYNGAGTRGGSTTDIEEINAVRIDFDGHRVVAEVNNPTSCLITIASMEGRIVERIHLEKRCSFNETIDTSSYPSGIYIVNITIGEDTISKKIIIQ